MAPGRVLCCLLLAMVADASPSLSQCPTTPLWQHAFEVTQAASDTRFGDGVSYFAHGPTVFAVWNETGSLPVPHVGGQVRWSWSANSDATIQNFPNPVPLSTPVASPGKFVFMTSSDGWLYKLDAGNGSVASAVDLKRPTCSSDKISGSPAVQLYQYSNSTFQNEVQTLRGHADDLVIVVTHYQCGGENQNRVYGLWAQDLSVKWVYNSSGATSMGPGTDACTVDYARNAIYCGTAANLPTQNTLRALNSLPGTTKWSANAGAVKNRPQLAPTRLYVAAEDGSARSFNPDTGSPFWSTTPGPAIVRGLALDAQSGPNKLYFTTEDGMLHGIRDDGAVATTTWPPFEPGGGLKFVGLPAIDPGSGKAYIGRSDGYLQQVSLGSGAPEVAVQVAEPEMVFDPSLDINSLGAPDVDRITVTARTGSIVRFCIPLLGSVSVPEPVATAGPRFARIAPNPFTGSAHVEYRLDTPARVEIAVHDVGGRRLTAIALEGQPAGVHRYEWDGLDEAGRPAPSGTYLLRIRVMGAGGEAFERSQKIQLVR